MQPKKQLKGQYIGIFEEIDSFYWPKMRFLKKGQKIRARVNPPPSFGQCPKETFFSVDVFPKGICTGSFCFLQSYIYLNWFFICPTFVCAFDAVIGEWLQKLAIAGDGVLEENGKN